MRGRRALVALAVAFVAIVPGALGHPLHQNPSQGIVGFDVESFPLDRGKAYIDVVVESGECMGGDPRSAAERFAHAEVTVERSAYVVSLVEDDDTLAGRVCFGVGTSYERRVTLPGRIGRRAIVSDNGPYSLPSVVLPPLGSRAARSLALRYLYADSACGAVANAFSGRPRASWCMG